MWVWFRLTTLGFIGGCDPEQGPVFSPAKDSITQIQSESDVLSYFEKSDPGLSVFLWRGKINRSSERLCFQSPYRTNSVYGATGKTLSSGR